MKSAGKSVSVSDYINHLPELGYQYQYDEKNRLVEKQLPGKGREFMVYDKEDRLVLYQDINMRNGSVNTTSENTTLNKGWTFTKYDKFGRILYTGYFKNTADRKAMEAALKNKTTPNNEVKSSTGFTNNGLRIYYTTNEFPKSSLIVHTVNYYDNYEFLELKPSDLNEQSLVNELDQELKGISVATFSNILGTNTWNKNFTFFENKYLRPVITTQLNYNGGKTETKTEYDSFRGKVVSTTTTHQLSLDTEPVIVKESFKYNPDESIQYQTHQINDGPEEYIVRNEYNDIKQLVRKKIGNSSLNSPLEQVDYKFNIRGWLTDINSIENTSDRLFSFKIKYHDSERGDNPYNGNIGEILWKINNGATKSYAYHYDGLNRLLLGKSTEVSNSIVSTNQYDERIYGYDFNGNILGLSRNTIGHELSLNGIQSIDQLEYQYKPNSNQLESVNDLTSNEQGFNDKNTTGADYEYDLNGNLKKDLNKNITNIAYNHLNLPIEVLFNNNGELSKIQFLYDASGVKVSKLVNDNLLIPYSENTFYDNGFQYKQSAGRGNNLSLQFFPTAEGYVNVNEGIFEYVYNYTDHLGNVRVSYTKGEDGNRKIVDENSYYPFGLKHNNQSIVNTANPNYKYKYNGKELQEELNLNLYDYGARNYDPAIGRWMNIDPLAEKMRRHSPYNYAFNNPVYFIDPDGMQTEDWKQDKLGNYVYDASLTKENASDKLSDDEKYLGESYSVEVRSNESGNSGTLNLNENGTASMTMGNTTLDLENNTFDLGFESGHKVMAGNYNESDMTSTSAFIGYSGSLLNKSEIMIKAGSKGGDLSNMRHISNTLKNTGKLGRGLGVLGIGVSIFEDYRSNNLGWGTGAKVVIRGGLLLVSAPVGLSIAAVDIGWGLATGTTITDNVANYVDKKMSK